MKKIITTTAMLFSVNFAMAGNVIEASTFFNVILWIACLILLIVIIVRFFSMSNDIAALRELITPKNDFSERIQGLINIGHTDSAIVALKEIMKKHPEWTPVYREAKELLDKIENQQ